MVKNTGSRRGQDKGESSMDCIVSLEIRENRIDPQVIPTLMIDHTKVMKRIGEGIRRGQAILKRGCCLNNGLVLQIDRYSMLL